MKVVLTLVMFVALTIVGTAQSFIGTGIQIKDGSFKLYDVPNSKVGEATEVGAFAEGAHDFQVGKAIVAPRVLTSIGRSYASPGEDYNQFDLRPEVEVRLPLAYGWQPLVAAGLSYTEGAKGTTQTNPILGAGLQYRDVRGSIYRFFPDADHGNARGILYRLDYTKKLSPVGVRVSAELFNGRSELKYAPKHPGYEGTTFTLRVGVVK